MASTNEILCNMINIQSVGNKTNIVRNLLIDQKLDILLLTETWLSNNISDNAKIKNMTPVTHNFYHVPREERSGGGVGIFVNKLYKVSIQNQYVANSFEHINVKISSNNKNIQVIVLYRPPNTNKRIFLEEFSEFLQLQNENKNILICGDFNIHLDEIENSYVKEFTELIECHDLENIVNEPTSLSNHIIDLVLQNKNNKIIKNIMIEPECDISPVHKLISFNINVWMTRPIKKTIVYRNKSNFDAEKFIDESSEKITTSDLKCRCKEENNQIGGAVEGCANCYTESSNNIFASEYDMSCPEVSRQIVVKENSRWFNSELLIAKRNKRRLEDRWKRSKPLKKQENYLLFKAARNYYNNLVEKTKKIYYKKRFKETKDSKLIQDDLDSLLGLKKEKVLPEIKEDLEALVNEFSDHFDEKIAKICRNFTTETTSNAVKLTVHVKEKFTEFKKLNMDEFAKVLNKVRNTYCGNDPFPISDIKNAKNFTKMQEIYYNIVNMSLLHGVFPKSEKLACVKPVYKGKGDKENLNSYRPISNLSYLSKVIETIVHDQTYNHLRLLNAISEHQSAYRKNHSTETTICSVVSDMIDIIEDSKCGILVMLDLSAAFDTVDHKLLLQDLLSVGIDGIVYEWYKSYLEDRRVMVTISNTKSKTKPLIRGVPQGSVLGPLLFSIYTIELSEILKKHDVKFKLYADDTQFYFPIETVEETKQKIVEIMKDIKIWMTKKKLKLNDEKTECMIFGSTNEIKKYDQFSEITIGSSVIKIKSVVRNLGVLIDKNLTMKDQILQTVKQCNYHIRNIAFVRKYLTEDILKKIMCSYVLSRLDYCNTVYNGLPNYLLKKLQVVQNRAARLIKGLSPRERVTPALMEMHWLPLKARVEYKTILLTYKALKYNEPKYLRKKLDLFNPETNVTIRHQCDIYRLIEPRTNIKLGERAFRYCAPRLYNKISVEVKNLEEKKFKKKLKTILFARSYDNVEKNLKDDYRL